MHPHTHPMFEELMKTVERPGDELAAARAHPDLTIGELLDLHRRVFGFTYSIDTPHELSHVLLGLIGYKRYQGDYEGECLTLAIEDALDEAMSGRNIWSEKHLGDRARFYHEDFAGTENLMRTLGYLLGKVTDRDPHSVMAGVAFESEDVMQLAERQGIAIINMPSINTTSQAWGVDTGATVYCFDGNPESPVCILPPGVEPMEKPTDSAIGDIFIKLNRVVPVLIDTLMNLRDTGPQGAARDLLDDHARIKQALLKMPVSLLLDNIDPAPPAFSGTVPHSATRMTKELHA